VPQHQADSVPMTLVEFQAVDDYSTGMSKKG
jgi:hypothetical protein